MTTIFRIFRPDGAKPDRVQKRRAQLREAQQTYRNRRDKYFKSLENEVQNARQVEANLSREVQRLQDTVQALVGFISQQGMALSDEVYELLEIGKSISNTPTTTYSLQGHENKLQIRGTKVESTESFGLYLSPETGKVEAMSQSASPEATIDNGIHQNHLPFKKSLKDGGMETPSPSQSSTIGGRQLQADVQMCDLDPVVVGIDFVLSLERPCLGHLHGDPNNPDEPAGHALTASAQLLCLSPSSSTSSPPSLESVHQDVPASMLDSLLNLSSQLCPPEDVTPVQAWNYIRSQPNFRGLEARSLHNFAEALLANIKCHGFGAVVKQNVFNKLVFDMLLLGRPL